MTNSFILVRKTKDATETGLDLDFLKLTARDWNLLTKHLIIPLGTIDTAVQYDPIASLRPITREEHHLKKKGNLLLYNKFLSLCQLN